MIYTYFLCDLPYLRLSKKITQSAESAKIMIYLRITCRVYPTGVCVNSQILATIKAEICSLKTLVNNRKEEE